MRTSTALALALAATIAAGCGQAPAQETGWGSAAESNAADAKQEIEVPPPPFSEGVFPCTDCHDPELPFNPKPRKLQMAHQDIVLKHDAEHRWCLDCHSATDRDKLHLASGELVDFKESYKLCGQCHGDKYRDWRAGVHGRRSGNWDGHKTYLLCVNCHNAHSPAFKPLKPLPPPLRPHGGDQ